MRKYQENRKSGWRHTTAPNPPPHKPNPHSTSQKTCKSSIKPPPPPQPHRNCPTPPQTRRQGPQAHRPPKHRPERSSRNASTACPGNPNTAPPPSGPREPFADLTRTCSEDKINHTGEFWKTPISKAYEKFNGFSRDLIFFLDSCKLQGCNSLKM